MGMLFEGSDFLLFTRWAVAAKRSLESHDEGNFRSLSLTEGIFFKRWLAFMDADWVDKRTVKKKMILK